MYTEKSPLTGGPPSYSFQNSTRGYKKQVKQFQCLLCAIALSLTAVALITSAMLYVDVDDIDSTTNENGSMPAMLQSSPVGQEEATMGKTADLQASAPLKPIKLYTSGTVIKGTATGGFVGEESHQIFDGTLPATIPLDPIVDPDAWTPTVDVTWSGVALNNNTVAGTFSVPYKIKNGTDGVVEKVWSASFEIELAFKWSSNLDMITPHKMYHCKAVFLTAYKSTLSESLVARATTKGKTDATTETCSVSLQGSFYEKSFFCFITPWWCTDDKLFYWNGEVEFKITKPPVPSQPSSDWEPIPVPSHNVLNEISPNLKAWYDEPAPVLVGWKILGQVANGWINVQDESGSKNIWGGNLPSAISLESLYIDKTLSSDEGLDVIWTCSVFSNSLRGNFKLALNNKLGSPKWMKGSFFFLLESSPLLALSTVFESGVTYKSSLYFKDSTEVINGTNVIPFYPHNTSTMPNVSWYRAPIILLGKSDKMTRIFEWDGRFKMIAKKDTKLSDTNVNLRSGSDDGMLKPDRGTEAPPESHVNSLSHVKLGGKISSGLITIQDDSGSKTVWNGSLPTEFSTRAIFFDPTFNTAGSPEEFGYGVVWSCSISGSSLRGSFKLPQYTKLGQVKWHEGSFVFQVESDPSGTLFDAISPNVDYSSPLHFRNSTTSYNGSNGFKYDMNSTKGLGNKAPIILLGELDIITKSFRWDGSFEMMLEKNVKFINSQPKQIGNEANENHQLKAESTSLSNVAENDINAPVVGTKLLGKVVSGWITVSEDSGTHQVWDGKFPAEISVPMFYNPTTDMSDLSDEYGHGVVWTCSVFQTTLKGSFKIPQYTKFGLVKWLHGNFLFQLEPSPYWSLYDAIVPGMSFYSPIHFRKAGKGFNDTRLINFHSYTQTSPLDDLGIKAPIALLGEAGWTGSSKSFLWDGRFVVVTKKYF